MFLNRFFLLAIIFLTSVGCFAQVTGSDTVCAGYIYTYNANIPGAASYTWTVPANWYGLSGQGTSQISVTCNANAGQVCVEGFDSIGISLGSQCLPTQSGGAGSSGWELQPYGNFNICDNDFSVNITPTIWSNGTGGGSCLSGCGTLSVPHPNLIWAIYNQTGNFIGLIGANLNLGLGTYYAYHIDTTLGRNFPQAIPIIDGCGGTVINSLTIGQVGANIVLNQSPNPVCIGDTVTITDDNGFDPPQWGPVWSTGGDLIELSNPYNAGHIDLLVTGPLTSLYWVGGYHINNSWGFSDFCQVGQPFYINIISCPFASSSFQSSRNLICQNDCIAFTNTSSNSTSYQWSFAGGIPPSSIDTNPANICYNNVGTYDVTLISSNATSSDTLILSNYITVVASPQSSFFANDTNFCPPHCIDFTDISSNASSYQWNFQGAFPDTATNTNPQSICYNSPGTYDVTLISTNSGCSDTLTLPNYINVYTPPQNSMGANPVSFCPGSCTDFTNFSSNATTYQWSFPGATVDTSTLVNPFGICYNNPGQYGVVLVSSNGVCTDTLSVINYITVYAQPSAISINNYNDSLVADQGFASYQWYLNGMVIPAATEYFYVATANGDYNVVATDSNGCEVEAVVFNVMVNVGTIFSEDRFSVIPNPFSNKLLFHPFHSSNEKTSIIVLNNIGEKLFEKQTSYKDQEIDLSFLDAGIYFLSVQTDEGIMLKKIVKM